MHPFHSTKDPYAYSGNPLTKKGSFTNADVLSNEKGALSKAQKQFYIESYGCQMNFSDSEIVASILNQEGYQLTEKIENANLVLVNTCSIREKAELTVRKRLELFNGLKRKNKHLKIGVLGCMAERLQTLSLIFIWSLVLASRFISSSSNRICTSSPEFHSDPIPPL
jgi:tRNA A37 methylthiotransferase MiaB